MSNTRSSIPHGDFTPSIPGLTEVTTLADNPCMAPSWISGYNVRASWNQGGLLMAKSMKQNWRSLSICTRRSVINCEVMKPKRGSSPGNK